MNDKIIYYLQQQQFQKAYAQAYLYFPKVKGHILKHGGNKADAEDVFQDGLLVMTENLTTLNYELKSSATTYLFGICKLLWLAKCRKQGKEIPTDEIPEVELNEDDLLEKLEKEKQFVQLGKVMNDIGEKCQELLLLFYGKKLSMKMIANKLKFSSEKIARNQKYKCLERAKNLVSTKNSS